MLALTTIFVNSFFAVVNAAFILKPIINEAAIGESTYFDCTTTTHTNEVFWYYYGVGAKDHEDICLYCLGKVHPLYETRIKVERIFATNSSRLKIRSVQREDAGRYICQDNGGILYSLSAQLVVIVSALVCHTNMKPDGLLGPNSCNMELDELQMSCNVSYHGNVPPLIQWREVQSADYIERGVSCKQTNNQATCKFSVNATLGLHGSSYICEAETSAATRYNCSSGVINVMHIDTDKSLTDMLYDTKSNVNCLARSSQPCNYTWKWVDGVHEEVVSNGTWLTPSKTGWYKCEAECNIRGQQCTVLSKLVRVSKQTTEAEMTCIITLGTLTVLMFSCILAFGAVSITCTMRRRNRVKTWVEPDNNDTEVGVLQNPIQALDNGPTTQMLKAGDV